MKPTKIAFTKKYFPEQYHGEDYFIEYILDEDDTIEDAFKQAKQDTFICFKNNNPQIQWNDEVINVDYSKINYTGLKRKDGTPFTDEVIQVNKTPANGFDAPPANTNNDEFIYGNNQTKYEHKNGGFKNFHLHQEKEPEK